LGEEGHAGSEQTILRDLLVAVLAVDEVMEVAELIDHARKATGNEEEVLAEVVEGDAIAKSFCVIALPRGEMLRSFSIVELSCVVVVDGEHVHLAEVDHDDEVDIPAVLDLTLEILGPDAHPQQADGAEDGDGVRGLSAGQCSHEEPVDEHECDVPPILLAVNEKTN